MNNKKEIILLNVTGGDNPGQISALMEILAKNKAAILDIGQAVIHDHLSLGILFEVPTESESSPILKDMLFTAYELGLKLKFTPVSEEGYVKWISSQGKERYIITLIGRKIYAEPLAGIMEVLYSQSLSVDIINRLSGRIPLGEVNDKDMACIELSVRGTPCDKNSMRMKFLEISNDFGVDIAFQEDNPFRRNRRLVCFDMDSTLIQTEVIVELAKYTGVGDRVHEITESAMRGEIDFDESFRQRISLLKGIDESVLQEIAENLPITEGAERLINTLKKFGYKTAILSGGFTYFGQYLQTKLGIDYVFANELEIIDGKFTGNYIGEIVNGERKAELLKELASKEDIQLDQVIAVGDGANDLPMLNLAGLGVAFHAKPMVQESAEQALSTHGLDAILYMLGFRDREVDEAQ